MKQASIEDWLNSLSTVGKITVVATLAILGLLIAYLIGSVSGTFRQ